MHIRQAFFFSPKASEWLILTANRNPQRGWYDYLPVKVVSSERCITAQLYDYGEFSTLKEVPPEYLRIKPEAVPAIIQNIAKREL